MEPIGEDPPPATSDGPDLDRLEQIEGELHAVERALEQIDQGIYDGFAGLGAVDGPARAAAVDPAPEPS